MVVYPSMRICSRAHHCCCVEINYSDFLAAAMIKRIDVAEERLILAFERLDPHGQGFIDIARLKEVLQSVMGDDESIAEMFTELDCNRDGKIDYIDFLGYWNSLVRSENRTSKEKLKSGIQQVVKRVRVLGAFGALKRSTSQDTEDTAQNVVTKNTAASTLPSLI